MNLNDVKLIFENGQIYELASSEINRKLRLINELQKIYFPACGVGKIGDCYNSAILITALNHYKNYLDSRLNELVNERLI